MGFIMDRGVSAILSGDILITVDVFFLLCFFVVCISCCFIAYQKTPQSSAKMP